MGREVGVGCVEGLEKVEDGFEGARHERHDVRVVPGERGGSCEVADEGVVVCYPAGGGGVGGDRGGVDFAGKGALEEEEKGDAVGKVFKPRHRDARHRGYPLGQLYPSQV